MSIRIESVTITPNPVKTGEQFIISAEVTLSIWGWIKKFAWKTLKKFSWQKAKNGEIDG